MSRVCLVTGATGLVGSRLVRELDGWDVHAVVRDAKRAPAGTRPVVADLAGAWDASVLPATVDAVVHLAQSDNYREFPAAADSIFRVNTASTLALLDHARRAGAKKFVLASTGGVYGSADRAFRETDVPAVDASPGTVSGEAADLAFYLRTRRSAELIAAAYQPHMDIAVLRFFFVYGPQQKSSMLVPRLVASVREGRPVTLQGTDGLKLNPVHVDDAARAVRAALSISGSTLVNVAGPQVLTLRAIAEAIGVAVGRAPVFSADAPGAEAHHLFGDVETMSRVLGAPAVRFADGVRTLA